MFFSKWITENHEIELVIDKIASRQLEERETELSVRIEHENFPTQCSLSILLFLLNSHPQSCKKRKEEKEE